MKSQMREKQIHAKAPRQIFMSAPIGTSTNSTTFPFLAVLSQVVLQRRYYDGSCADLAGARVGGVVLCLGQLVAPQPQQRYLRTQGPWPIATASPARTSSRRRRGGGGRRVGGVGGVGLEVPQRCAESVALHERRVQLLPEAPG